jgi:heat shock protein HslJ
MMACSPEEVMDSESAYLEALSLVDTFTMSGDRLTLTGEGVEIAFVALEA